MLIDIIAIFEGTTGQDGQADAEDLSKGGIDIGRVVSFLDEVTIDLFGCKV